MVARHGQETVSRKARAVEPASRFPAPHSERRGCSSGGSYSPALPARPGSANRSHKQINANRREQAHPVFRKWAKDLKQGVLQQLHETQVEQDFNHVLLRGLGYTTQSDVASDQPWTLTPKWNVPGSGEVDASLGRFRLDESGWLSGEPLVRVELKGGEG